MPEELVLERNAQRKHSDEHKCLDLVLITLVILFSERGQSCINRRRFHQAWETYLWLLKKNGQNYDGFYRDITTGTYRSLDDAITQLLGLFVYYKFPERGDFIHLSFVRKHIVKIKANADPEEWEAIRKSVRYLVRRFHRPRKSQWY